MNRIAICLSIALDVALVIWGQQTHPSMIPTSPVVNVSVGVFVGEPVTVGEDVRVTIDCSPLIDEAINNGILNPTVTWFKDRAELSNGSAPNVEISADRRRLIITNTSLAVGGRLGTEGNYTCKVKNRISSSRVCVEANFMQPVSPPVVTPFCISLTCGQDIAVETLEGVLGLTISCEIYSELDSLTTEVYKDGVLISRCFQLHFKSVSNYHFGTYTFVVSTKFCGSTTVVSRIFHKVIERGSEPLSVENGVIRVNVGSTVYTVNGLTIIIICNVITGDPPITISWYHNGELDRSRGNVSTITITNATDGDVFTCRAEDMIGFDQQDTSIRFANNTFCIDAS